MKTPFPAVLIQTTTGEKPSCRFSLCNVMELRPEIEKARVWIATPGTPYAVEKWVPFSDLASSSTLAATKGTKALFVFLESLPALGEKPAAAAVVAGDGTRAGAIST